MKDSVADAGARVRDTQATLEEGAGQLEASALQADYAQWSVRFAVAMAAWMVYQLMTAVAAAGGIAALLIPEVLAGARQSVREIVWALVGELRAGVIQGVGQDAATQLIQFAEYRKGWDWASAEAAAVGAAAGAAGGGVRIGWGHLPVGDAGRLLAHPVAGVAGGVASVGALAGFEGGSVDPKVLAEAIASGGLLGVVGGGVDLAHRAVMHKSGFPGGAGPWESGLHGEDLGPHVGDEKPVLPAVEYQPAPAAELTQVVADHPEAGVVAAAEHDPAPTQTQTATSVPETRMEVEGPTAAAPDPVHVVAAAETADPLSGTREATTTDGTAEVPTEPRVVVGFPGPETGTVTPSAVQHAGTQSSAQVSATAVSHARAEVVELGRPPGSTPAAETAAAPQARVHEVPVTAEVHEAGATPPEAAETAAAPQARVHEVPVTAEAEVHEAGATPPEAAPSVAVPVARVDSWSHGHVEGWFEQLSDERQQELAGLVSGVSRLSLTDTAGDRLFVQQVALAGESALAEHRGEPGPVPGGKGKAKLVAEGPRVLSDEERVAWRDGARKFAESKGRALEDALPAAGPRRPSTHSEGTEAGPSRPVPRQEPAVAPDHRSAQAVATAEAATGVQEATRALAANPAEHHTPAGRHTLPPIPELTEVPEAVTPAARAARVPVVYGMFSHASGAAEITGRIRELLPKGSAKGLDAIEDAVALDFAGLVGGRRFAVRARGRWFEATITAEPDLRHARPYEPGKDELRKTVTTLQSRTRVGQTATTSKPTELAVGGTVSGTPVGPIGSASMRTFSARPSVTTSQARTELTTTAVKGKGGDERSRVPVRYTVRVADDQGRPVGGPEPIVVRGEVHLALPGELAGLEPFAHPAGPVGLSLDRIALPELLLARKVTLLRDPFADLANRLGESAALGSPGRAELQEFLSPRSLEARFRDLLHGEALSGDLLSADGRSLSVARMKLEMEQAEVVGVYTDNLMEHTVSHRSVADFTVTTTTESGAEVSVGAGGGGSLAGVARVAGAVTTTVGSKVAHSATSGDSLGWSSAVTHNKDMALVRIRGTVRAGVLGEDSTVGAPVEAYVLTSTRHAAELGLPLPEGRSTPLIDNPEPGVPRTPSGYDTGGLLGPHHVMNFDGGEEVHRQITMVLRAERALGKVLTSFSDPALARYSADERAAVVANLRELAKFSPDQLSRRLPELFGDGVRGTFRVNDWRFTRYFEVKVTARRVGAAEHLGRLPNHYVGSGLDSSTQLGGSRTRTTAVNASADVRVQEGQVISPIAQVTLVTGGVRGGRQTTASVSAGPSAQRSMSLDGSPHAHLFDLPVEFDISITRYKLPRQWTRAFPGLPGKHVPEVRSLAEARSPEAVRPPEADPAGPAVRGLFDRAATKRRTEPIELDPVRGTVRVAVAEDLTTTAETIVVPGAPRIEKPAGPAPAIVDLPGVLARERRPDFLAVVAVAPQTSAALHEAATQAMHDAAEGDAVLLLPGGANARRLEVLNPRTLGADIDKLLAGTFTISGLNGHSRRIEERVGGVGLALDLSNPQRVGWLDSTYVRNDSGGYKVGATTGTSTGLAVSAGVNENLRPAEQPFASGNIGLSGQVKAWTRTSTRTERLDTTIEHTVDKDRPVLDVLVQYDAKFHVVAASREQSAGRGSLFPHESTELAWRTVTVEHGVLVRMTPDQAREQGLLPGEPGDPARTGRPVGDGEGRTLHAPPGGAGQLANHGILTIDQAPDTSGLLSDLRESLPADLVDKLLPENVLDDRMGNRSRAGGLLSGQTVTGMVHSLFEDGVPVVLHRVGLIDSKQYLLVLTARQTGAPRLLGVQAWDGRYHIKITHGADRAENRALTTSSNARSSPVEAVTPSKAGQGVLATAGGGGGTSVQTQQGRSSGRGSSNSRTSTLQVQGPLARFDAEVTLKLALYRDGQEIASVQRPGRIAYRLAAEDLSTHPEPVLPEPGHSHGVVTADRMPELLDRWRAEGITGPIEGLITAERSGLVRRAVLDAARRIDADIRVLLAGGQADALFRSVTSPEFVHANLSTMLTRGVDLAVLEPFGLKAVVYARLSRRADLVSFTEGAETTEVTKGGANSDSGRVDGSGASGALTVGPVTLQNTEKTLQGGLTGAELRRTGGQSSTMTGSAGTSASTQTASNGRIARLRHGIDFLVAVEQVRPLRDAVRGVADALLGNPPNATVGLAELSLPNAASRRLHSARLDGAVGELPDRLLAAQKTAGDAAKTWKTAEQSVQAKRREVDLAEDRIAGEPDRSGTEGLDRAREELRALDEQARRAADAWFEAKRELDLETARFNDARHRVDELIEALTPAHGDQEVHWLADPGGPVDADREIAVSRFRRDDRYFTIAMESPLGDGRPTWRGRPVEPEQLARAVVGLRERGVWSGERPLQLAVCGAGRGDASSYAARVLKEVARLRSDLPLKLVAPEEGLWYLPDRTDARAPGELLAAGSVGYDAQGVPGYTPGNWVRLTLSEDGSEVTAERLGPYLPPETGTDAGRTAPKGFREVGPEEADGLRGIPGAVKFGPGAGNPAPPVDPAVLNRLQQQYEVLRGPAADEVRSGARTLDDYRTEAQAWLKEAARLRMPAEFLERVQRRLEALADSSPDDPDRLRAQTAALTGARVSSGRIAELLLAADRFRPDRESVKPAQWRFDQWVSALTDLGEVARTAEDGVPLWLAEHHGELVEAAQVFAARRGLDPVTVARLESTDRGIRAVAEQFHDAATTFGLPVALGGGGSLYFQGGRRMIADLDFRVSDKAVGFAHFGEPKGEDFLRYLNDHLVRLTEASGLPFEPVENLGGGKMTVGTGSFLGYELSLSLYAQPVEPHWLPGLAPDAPRIDSIDVRTVASDKFLTAITRRKRDDESLRKVAQDLADMLDAIAMLDHAEGITRPGGSVARLEERLREYALDGLTEYQMANFDGGNLHHLGVEKTVELMRARLVLTAGAHLRGERQKSFEKVLLRREAAVEAEQEHRAELWERLLAELDATPARDTPRRIELIEQTHRIRERMDQLAEEKDRLEEQRLDLTARLGTLAALPVSRELREELREWMSRWDGRTAGGTRHGRFGPPPGSQGFGRPAGAHELVPGARPDSIEEIYRDDFLPEETPYQAPVAELLAIHADDVVARLSEHLGGGPLDPRVEQAARVLAFSDGWRSLPDPARDADTLAATGLLRADFEAAHRTLGEAGLVVLDEDGLHLTGLGHEVLDPPLFARGGEPAQPAQPMEEAPAAEAEPAALPARPRARMDDYRAGRDPEEVEPDAPEFDGIEAVHSDDEFSSGVERPTGSGEENHGRPEAEAPGNGVGTPHEETAQEDPAVAALFEPAEPRPGDTESEGEPGAEGEEFEFEFLEAKHSDSEAESDWHVDAPRFERPPELTAVSGPVPSDAHGSTAAALVPGDLEILGETYAYRQDRSLLYVWRQANVSHAFRKGLRPDVTPSHADPLRGYRPLSEVLAFGADENTMWIVATRDRDYRPPFSHREWVRFLIDAPGGVGLTPDSQEIGFLGGIRREHIWGAEKLSPVSSRQLVDLEVNGHYRPDSDLHGDTEGLTAPIFERITDGLPQGGGLGEKAVYEQLVGELVGVAGAGQHPIPYRFGKGGQRIPRFGLEIEFGIPTAMLERIAILERMAILERIAERLHQEGVSLPGIHGYHSSQRDGYSNDVSQGRVELDSTVFGEYVTAIWDDDEPSTWANLVTVMKVIREEGGQTDYDAGAHIHFSLDYHEQPELAIGRVTTLVNLVKAYEDVLYQLGQDPHGPSLRGTDYAAPLDVTPSAGYSRRAKGLPDVPVPPMSHDLKALLRDLGSSRKVGVNFRSVHGKDGDHIEVRIADGNLDPRVTQTLVELWGSIVVYAHDHPGVSFWPAVEPLGAAVLRDGVNPGGPKPPLGLAEGMKLTEHPYDRSRHFTHLVDLVLTDPEAKKRALALWLLTQPQTGDRPFGLKPAVAWNEDWLPVEPSPAATLPMITLPDEPFGEHPLSAEHDTAVVPGDPGIFGETYLHRQDGSRLYVWVPVTRGRFDDLLESGLRPEVTPTYEDPTRGYLPLADALRNPERTESMWVVATRDRGYRPSRKGGWYRFWVDPRGGVSLPEETSSVGFFGGIKREYIYGVDRVLGRVDLDRDEPSILNPDHRPQHERNHDEPAPFRLPVVERLHSGSDGGSHGPESLDNPVVYQHMVEEITTAALRGEHPLGEYRLDGRPDNPEFGFELEFNHPDEELVPRFTSVPPVAEELARRLNKAGVSVPGVHPAHTSDQEGYSRDPGHGRVELDRSVCAEYVSAIRVDDPRTWSDLAVVTSTLRDLGAQAGFEAGGHIHISVKDFHQPPELALGRWTTFVRLVKAFEDPLYQLSQDPHAARHRGIHNAEPLSVAPSTGYTRRAMGLPEKAEQPTHRDVDELLNELRYDRTRITNFGSVWGKENDHLEIRVPDASLDERDIKITYRLWAAILDYARDNPDVSFHPGAQPLGSRAADPDFGSPEAISLREGLRLTPYSYEQSRPLIQLLDLVVKDPELKRQVLAKWLLTQPQTGETADGEKPPVDWVAEWHPVQSSRSVEHDPEPTPVLEQL
ncbi:hypothetical protein [Kitasatospora sp. NPDC093102]|uniref:hypothetical protein n=1 Tax=Kitasatospora sp. NPDC093102 TaxID=3155069 RepID=UPI00344AF436